MFWDTPSTQASTPEELLSERPTISQSTSSPPFVGGPSQHGGHAQSTAQSGNLQRQAQYQRATQSQSRSSSANRGGYGAPSPTASSNGLSPAASTTSQTSGSSTGKKLQKLAPKPVALGNGTSGRPAGTGNVQITRTGHGIEVGISGHSAAGIFSSSTSRSGQRNTGSASSSMTEKARTNISGGKGGRFTVDSGGGYGPNNIQMAQSESSRRQMKAQQGLPVPGSSSGAGHRTGQQGHGQYASAAPTFAKPSSTRNARPIPSSMTGISATGQVAQSPRAKNHQQVHFMPGSLPNSASSSRAQTPAMQMLDMELAQSASSMTPSNLSRSANSSHMGYSQGFNPRSSIEQSPLSQSVPRFGQVPHLSGSMPVNPFAQPARARKASGAHHHPYSRSGTSTPLEPPSPWETNGPDFPFHINPDDANAIAMALAGQQEAQNQHYAQAAFEGWQSSNPGLGSLDAEQLLSGMAHALRTDAQSGTSTSRPMSAVSGNDRTRMGHDPQRQDAQDEETQRIKLENAVLKNMLAGGEPLNWNAIEGLSRKGMDGGSGEHASMDRPSDLADRNMASGSLNGQQQNAQFELSAAGLDAILMHESFGKIQGNMDASAPFFNATSGMSQNMQSQGYEATGQNRGKTIPQVVPGSGTLATDDGNPYGSSFGSASVRASTPSLLTQQFQQGLPSGSTSRPTTSTMDRMSASLPNGSQPMPSTGSAQSTIRQTRGGVLPTPPASFSQSFAYPPGRLGNHTAAGWGPSRGVQEKGGRTSTGLSVSATAASRNMGLYTPLITPTALVENMSLASPTTPVSRLHGNDVGQRKT